MVGTRRAFLDLAADEVASAQRSALLQRITVQISEPDLRGSF
jgi:hypothetical protein